MLSRFMTFRQDDDYLFFLRAYHRRRGPLSSTIMSQLKWELKLPQEKLKTMLMQNYGVTNKEHYGMLWYVMVFFVVVNCSTLLRLAIS